MAIEFAFKRTLDSGSSLEYTITVSDEEWDWEYEEEEEEEEEEDDGVTCPVCERKFASPGNLKQHQTVKDH